PVKEEQDSGVEDNKLSSSNGGNVGHRGENGSSIDHNGMHLEKAQIVLQNIAVPQSFLTLGKVN
ncbi:hypothetical protein A2U01_0072412, partial [Trifolium medium]|nr:hypothetical protein [Trifolium medium]